MAVERRYINVPEKIYHGFIYYLSGLVLTTLSDEHADDMFNLAKVNLGITDK